MTPVAPFTSQEWERLGRAPFLVGFAITLADPGGPVGTAKESAAALRTVAMAARDGEFGAFPAAIAKDVLERAQEHGHPLAGSDLVRAGDADAILAELQGVAALLRMKAERDDQLAYIEWLRITAQNTSLAAREGGFLGLGGAQVSEREQQMLERIGDIFGAPRS